MATTDGEERALTVEDGLVRAATPHLLRYRPEPMCGYSLPDVFLLPREELTTVCHEAMDAALQSLVAASSGRQVLLTSVHPVLYHQLTREFLSPYQPSEVGRLLAKHGIQAAFVVSIHDDVYDIYKRLLRPGRLFAPTITRDPIPREPPPEGPGPRESTRDPIAGGSPKEGPGERASYPREPLRDVQEQLLLLNWRGRELSQAKSLATGLGARHYLFHQKGHLESLWRVVGLDSCSVYFSHPISQPRRDMLGLREPGKCEKPDPERGRSFQRACMDFSGKLRNVVPTVEPTAIDELRLNFSWLGGKTEESLRECILPPLHPRWPVNDGPHVGGALPDDLHTVPLLPAPDSAFQSCRFGTEPLASHAAGLKILKEEIRRQINVRDHSLAEQCDLVVAFRPFSLPDSPAPSGGVRKEIDVVSRKVALGKRVCKPALIVLHPLQDERDRRQKEFDQKWDDLAREAFAAADSDKLGEFRRKVRDFLISAPYRLRDEEVRVRLKAIIKQLGLQCTPLQDDSSMAGGEFGRAEEALEQFLAKVVKKTSIVRTFLHEAEEGGTKGYVELVEDIRPNQGLLGRIRAIVDNGNGPGRQS